MSRYKEVLGFLGIWWFISVFIDYQFYILTHHVCVDHFMFNVLRVVVCFYVDA